MEVRIGLENLQEPAFIRLGQPRTINGWNIDKYFCDLGEGDERAERITQVANAILGLQRAGYCCTFHTDRAVLGNLLEQNRYLTVINQTISLAPERDAPAGIDPTLIDYWFSETLLRVPVKCAQDHFFERSRANFWKQRMGNVCPVGPAHPIGNLDVRMEQFDAARQIREAEEMERQRVDRVVAGGERIEAQALIEQAQNANNQMQAAVNHGQTSKLCAVAGFVKLAAKAIAVKVVGVEVAKKGIQAQAKWFPVVGLIAAGAGAGYRFYHGQYFKGVLEIVSGVASCVPVYGTAVSIAIDAGLVISDGIDALRAPVDTPQQQLNGAYRVLRIDPAVTPTPDQGDIDRVFRRQARVLAYDGVAGQVGDYVAGHFNRIQADLNAQRDLIYQLRGFELRRN